MPPAAIPAPVREANIASRLGAEQSFARQGSGSRIRWGPAPSRYCPSLRRKELRRPERFVQVEHYRRGLPNCCVVSIVEVSGSAGFGCVSAEVTGGDG